MTKEKVTYRDNDNVKPSTAKVLIEALPYIQQLSNKVIVVIVTVIKMLWGSFCQLVNADDQKIGAVVA